MICAVLVAVLVASMCAKASSERRALQRMLIWRQNAGLFAVQDSQVTPPEHHYANFLVMQGVCPGRRLPSVGGRGPARGRVSSV